jgi:DNA polymerase phi
LHFRNRVLDLVDAFLKSQPSNPRVHIFILPMLVSATQSSKTEKEFSDKLSSIIRSRFGKAKIVALDEAETMKQTLLELHEMAEKSTSSNQLYTIGCCCVYISRGLVDVSQQGLVAKTYGNSLKAYSQKKGTQLNPAFFTEICKRLPEVGWMMRDDVLDAYDIAINAYRRTQMLQLASTIITQHQLDEGQVSVTVQTRW